MRADAPLPPRGPGRHARARCCRAAGTAARGAADTRAARLVCLLEGRSGGAGARAAATAAGADPRRRRAGVRRSTATSRSAAHVPSRPRTDHNPLNRKEYLLHVGGGSSERGDEPAQRSPGLDWGAPTTVPAPPKLRRHPRASAGARTCQLARRRRPVRHARAVQSPRDARLSLSSSSLSSWPAAVTPSPPSTRPSRRRSACAARATASRPTRPGSGWSRPTRRTAACSPSSRATRSRSRSARTPTSAGDRACLPPVRAEETAAAHRRRHAHEEERRPALDGHAAAGGARQGRVRLPHGVRPEARIGAMAEIGTMRVKSGLAEMLKGGVIMDVTTADQARIAEDAGAVRGHGARARPGRHPRRGRRRAHGRSGQDRRDPGGRDHPRDGEGAHRPLRRGADPRGARGRLHRRVGGADARRTPRTTSTSGSSPSRSSAAARTSARRCGASPRARR